MKLAKLENLNRRVYKESGTRKVGDAVDDTVAEKLAKVQTPDEMSEFAAGFGIPADVIAERAKTAPNFGQFRMTVGNMIRGVQSRKARYEEITGKKCALVDVGTKKQLQAMLSEWRKSQKPVKDGAGAKKSEKKPVKSKKSDAVKTETKTAKGLDGKTRQVTHEVVEERKGAPSKAEAAARGKGGKKRAAKAAKQAASDSGVDQQGDGTSEQADLANAVAGTNA